MRFPPKVILAPTDFSLEAEFAVNYAFDMASHIEARVHLLHAYHIPLLSEAGPATQKLMEDLHRGAESMLLEVAERYKSPAVIGQLLVKTGDARELIVESAIELRADLIVMGTHGRKGFKRMLLGSVAEGVVRRAPCGVLVIPPR